MKGELLENAPEDTYGPEEPYHPKDSGDYQPEKPDYRKRDSQPDIPDYEPDDIVPDDDI